MKKYIIATALVLVLGAAAFATSAQAGRIYGDQGLQGGTAAGAPLGAPIQVPGRATATVPRDYARPGVLPSQAAGSLRLNITAGRERALANTKGIIIKHVIYTIPEPTQSADCGEGTTYMCTAWSYTYNPTTASCDSYGCVGSGLATFLSPF